MTRIRMSCARAPATTIAASWLLLLAASGCESTGDTAAGTDADTDGDSDADADTDGDTDTDADTDTDTDDEVPVIPTTCEEAAAALTSVGCAFFAADLDQYSLIDPDPYSIVVSNPQQSADAAVTLEDGVDGVIYSTVLGPGELEVIDVACDSGCLVPPRQIETQGLSPASGFRLGSDVPVLAYQWNPYGTDMMSTDASLLIPTTSLDGTYIAAAWGTSSVGGEATSQVTVIATQDDTHLTFIPSVAVPDLHGVGPFTAGVESAEHVLDSYDVITISPLAVNADLTGTAVLADKPVVVFGGHSCANVPDGATAACDHVEEQMLPLAAWGTSAVLARHAPTGACTFEENPVRWRVIAGADDMAVHFDPPAPAPAGASYHFASQGELLEFDAPGDYFVWGVLDAPEDPEHPEAPFFAYQMMMGASYASTCNDYDGDPMMLQSPPAGQFLNRYTFNTDNVFDFRYDHIVVVRPAGVEVTLDCIAPLPDEQFTPVGSSGGWEVGRFFVDDPEGTTGCSDGAHLIFSAEPFGLSVVGVSTYNSYGYLGGIGVRAINPDPVIE